MEDKEIVTHLLCLQNVFLKAKAEMDQFMEGLKCLNMLEKIKENPAAYKHYFVYNKLEITAGI